MLPRGSSRKLLVKQSPKVQSEEICKAIVNDIVDKMFMQENSTLEITHDEEHDQPTLKRKHGEDGNSTAAERNYAQDHTYIKKKYKIDYEDLEEKKCKK